MSVASLSGLERHVQNTLANYPIIAERRYASADYGACDVLMDLDKAISRAELTEQQALVFDLLYNKYRTQVEVSALLNISQPTVFNHNRNAVSKIANQLR